jgi:hypothetical protein
LRRAGYNFFELVERPSEFALPLLLEQGMRVDFAFIDGWHTFDHTLLDFFYLQRMLNVGGIILIDDVGMQSINKVVRYILQFPHIKYLASANTYNEKHLGWRYAIKEYGKSVFGSLASTLLGKNNAAVILDDSVLRSNRSLGLNASMMAFQKVGEDSRRWDWYSKF